MWAFINANPNNNTDDDNTFTDNWYNGGATEVATGAPPIDADPGLTTVVEPMHHHAAPDQGVPYNDQLGSHR